MIAPMVGLVREPDPELAGIKIRLPEDAARFLMSRVKGLDREWFGTVLVNTRNRVIDVDVVSIGSLNGTLVTPREVFKPALLTNAAALVLWHNHPSGEVEPSSEDVALTRRLKHAGQVLGIKVLDHVIVTKDRYYSFQESGAL